MKIAMVLTTINVPDLIIGYADNFEKYGHQGEVGFIIIGDLKTPQEAKVPVEKIRKRGFEAEYLDIPQQEEWLKRFPELKQIIPYNSDNRRNIGYLMAVEQGAEVIISLDDDNYAGEGDYLKAHKVVGCRKELKMAHSRNSWFNICSQLEVEPPRTIYPRGFPYSKRWSDSADFTISSGRIVMNAGLWLGDPDVDAVTRLNEPIRAVGASSEMLMLAPEVYCSINTQNTAFHRDVLPGYYFVTMKAQINGNKIDRYGDIWSGLFALKVINQMKDRVSFGPPLTDHRRNKHNLLKDLQEELWGMILTESLIPILDSIQLTATTYHGAYLELANKLEERVSLDGDFTPGVKNYFSQVTSAMRIWVDVCREVMG